MITLVRTLIRLSAALLFCFCIGAVYHSALAEPSMPPAIANLSPAEALKLGEMMYRQGILPSGEPMEAAVKGDIRVDGRMFTCSNCHLRSGIGTFEGGVLTTPINGPSLFLPLNKFDSATALTPRRALKLFKMEGVRPAYTYETLADSIWAGKDSAGRQMDDIMPKYFLTERDMAIMVYYLKNLSAQQEPGVSDTTLRFATIVTDEVSKEDRDAMLVPLQVYIQEKSLVRPLPMRTRRPGKLAYVDERMYRGFRIMSLAVWELKGPRETWREQLEAYYRKDPVFALLGGITTGEWDVIHKFCEDHKIPSFFPITDYPVLSEQDWHTMYLSKGIAQEGDAAARYLNNREDLPKDLPIVEITRNSRKAQALSRAFRERWEGYGRKAPEQLVLEASEKVTKDFWKNLSVKHKRCVVLLWLDEKDKSALDSLAKTDSKPEAVFISSSLQGKNVYTLPEKARELVYIAYPYALPQESKEFLDTVEAMMKKNKIPDANKEIAYKTASFLSILSGPLNMMKNYIYRDYLLELMDMMPDAGGGMPTLYSRLSFGTGQRYASKGCYIVQLTSGSKPELVKRSEWVIPE